MLHVRICAGDGWQQPFLPRLPFWLTGQFLCHKIAVFLFCEARDGKAETF